MDLPVFTFHLLKNNTQPKHALFRRSENTPLRTKYTNPCILHCSPHSLSRKKKKRKEKKKKKKRETARTTKEVAYLEK